MHQQSLQYLTTPDKTKKSPHLNAGFVIRKLLNMMFRFTACLHLGHLSLFHQHHSSRICKPFRFKPVEINSTR